ncbi:glutamate racemase [soil metagenome]
MSDPRPIGFFDSGLGGLTVLFSIRERFPHENFIYLGDTARLPYGTKSPETIRRYTEQCIRALLKFNVKAIVVACNSASTAILNFKATDLAIASPVPLYNVIEPGADVAVRTSTSKRIGVLGTRATVASNAYVQAIEQREPLAVVFQQAAPLLVPLVEEGWEADPLTNLIIYRYLAPLLSKSIDTLILGCTHYPALREGFAKVAGASIELVDSAVAIAEQLEKDFADATKLKPLATDSSQRGTLALFATDASPSMDLTARRLMKDDSLSSFQGFDL